MTARKADWNALAVGEILRNPVKEVSYRVVRIAGRGDARRVWAQWRKGLIGRFGKEVVELLPDGLRGFRHLVRRRAPPR